MVVIDCNREIWLGILVSSLLEASSSTSGLIPFELMRTFRVALSCESERPKLASYLVSLSTFCYLVIVCLFNARTAQR